MTTALQEHVLPPEAYAIKDELSNTKGSDHFQHIPSNDSSKIEPQSHIITKLKAQNKNLEYQLQSLKFQLDQFLEKKKTLGGRTKSSVHVGFGVNSHVEENPRISRFQKELDTVYREIDFYKKEIKILQLGHTDFKALDRFDEAGNKLSALQVEMKCLELEKKTLEKTLKDKSKLLRELQDINERAPTYRESEIPLSEELKSFKARVKDIQKREQDLEKDAQKRNQYILRLMGRMTTMKEDYRQMLTKTGYDPVEDRIKSTKASVSPIKRPVKILAYSPTTHIRNKKDDFVEMRLETNEDNFENLKEAVRDYKRLELQKQKAFKLQMDRYKEMLDELEKSKHEVSKKAEEKEMEASILRNRTKELYRMLLQLGLLPPGRDYEGLLKDKHTKTPVLKKTMPRRSFSVVTGFKDDSRYLRTNETPSTRLNKNSRLDTEEIHNMGDLGSSQFKKNVVESRGFDVKKVLKGTHGVEEDKSFAGTGKDMGKSINSNKWLTPRSEKKVIVDTKDVKQTHNTEEVPLNDEMVEDLVPDVVVDTMVKGLMYNGYRMDEVGQKMEKEGSKNFNDQAKIHGNSVKISLVKVFYDGEDVAGFYTEYRSKYGEIIKGDEHTFDDGKYKSVELVMDKGDFLKKVSGFVNSTNDKIEAVRLVSDQGVTVNAGKEKKGNKPFSFDINELEFPVMLHGSFKGKKNGKGSVVCRLGALIKADEIEEDIQEKEESRSSDNKKLKQIN